MPIYVDKIFEMDPMLFKSNPLAKQASRYGVQWCHLWADKEKDIEELHKIALKIGLKKAYFQNRKDFPHYDLIPRKRIMAIKAGAIEIELRKWLQNKE